MENLLFLLATSFAIRRLSAPRKFKSCFIGDTGCSALLFSGNETIDRACTSNGDEVYYHEFSDKKVSYGMICIRLREQYDLYSAEELLSVYMNKLRKPFRALHQTGLTPDADWNQTGTLAMTDYWQDKKGVDWKVKGYTNGRFMAVMYVKNIGQAEMHRQELFLDSFHFGQ